MKLIETKRTRTTLSYLADKDHPVWGLAKTALIAGLLTLYLRFNANHFDQGEVRTVIMTWLSSIALEGIRVQSKRSKRNKDRADDQD